MRALRAPCVVAAGGVTGVRPGTPPGSATTIGNSGTITAICAVRAGEVTSLVPLVTATSAMPLIAATVAALFAVPAVPTVPAARRPLLIFGGLLRRSEPSPIATAAARRAAIGRRGGRSVHGLPRLERLTIAFALPQFGICPEFPRPVGILNRSEPARQHPPKRTPLSSSGTARGPVPAACHPMWHIGRTAGNPGAAARVATKLAGFVTRRAVRSPTGGRTPEVCAVPLPYDRTRPYPQYLNTQPLNRKQFLRPGDFRVASHRTQFIGHGVRIGRGQPVITRRPAPARTPRADRAPRTHRTPDR